MGARLGPKPQRRTTGEGGALALVRCNSAEPRRQPSSSRDPRPGIAEWLGERTAEGLQPHEIGVFVRSQAEMPRALAAVWAAGLEGIALDDVLDGKVGSVAISTMYLAKGLEFRTVVVAACDDEIIPLQARIERVADDADLEDVYDTERQLLYVACTRARDHLLVTSVEPASEFLDDMRGNRA